MKMFKCDFTGKTIDDGSDPVREVLVPISDSLTMKVVIFEHLPSANAADAKPNLGLGDLSVDGAEQIRKGILKQFGSPNKK